MWLTEATSLQRRTLLAASLGWMLDSMNVLLYSMVLTAMMAEMHMDTGMAGLMNSLTLAASAVGGIIFGVLADRIGRSRSLMASIVVYSVFTAACGLSQNLVQLAIFRVIVGLGMGGEWASGAALVAETWPAQHRGKAFGIMQSSWAVGFGLAAAVTAIFLPRFGWRAVFFVGLVPALITFWIQRYVPEPEIWLRSRRETRSRPVLSSLAVLWDPKYRRDAIVTTVSNAGTMFGWWGLFMWMPAYLSLPIAQGGAGLSIVKTSSWIILMQVGMWLGYVSFGYFSDWFGRKKAYVSFIFIAACIVPVYGITRDPTVLLLIGPVVAFFGTGYFSGFGAITAEIFPTAVRASAQGLTYNLGRGVSAAAPFLVGELSAGRGLGMAFLLTSAAFFVAGFVSLLLPETQGRELV